jgi:hypothetical protein
MSTTEEKFIRKKISSKEKSLLIKLQYINKTKL